MAGLDKAVAQGSEILTQNSNYTKIQTNLIFHFAYIKDELLQYQGAYLQSLSSSLQCPNMIEVAEDGSNDVDDPRADNREQLSN